jgi:hypothetical protein
MVTLTTGIESEFFDLREFFEGVFVGRVRENLTWDKKDNSREWRQTLANNDTCIISHVTRHT